ISVSFVLKSNIVASAGPGGSISPSGTVTVTCGGSQSFTITPASCYAIVNVVVDGSSVGPVASYTFNNVTAGHTISASFADATAPVVTLNGTSPMTVECHASFSDPGATASDACDASVSATTVSGSVDHNTPGSYTLTYSATDASGNTGTA